MYPSFTEIQDFSSDTCHHVDCDHDCYNSVDILLGNLLASLDDSWDFTATVTRSFLSASIAFSDKQALASENAWQLWLEMEKMWGDYRSLVCGGGGKLLSHEGTVKSEFEKLMFKQNEFGILMLSQVFSVCDIGDQWQKHLLCFMGVCSVIYDVFPQESALKIVSEIVDTQAGMILALRKKVSSGSQLNSASLGRVNEWAKEVKAFWLKLKSHGMDELSAANISIASHDDPWGDNYTLLSEVD